MLLQLGGRHICFDLLGDEGAPVVCLAHSLSADMGIWAEQVSPLLARGWRVLRIDMRGHGGSSPGCEEAYTMPGLAQDVVAVLNLLGLDKVHFAGVSIGGMIGQQLGIDHPHRLISLMLCDTAATNIPGGETVWIDRFAAMRNAGSLEPLADATMDRWVTEEFKTANPERWNVIRATVAATTLAGYFGGGMAILTFDSRSQLASIKVPTMIVWGSNDTGTPPAGNALIADAIPGSKRSVFEGARHIPMVEQAEAFTRVMANWLADQRGAPVSEPIIY